MKRTPHYTCRHSCNCDGRVRVYLPVQIYPTRPGSPRVAERYCRHMCVCISFLFLFSSLFSSPPPPPPLIAVCAIPVCFFASGNGKPDMGVTRGAILNATCNAELCVSVCGNASYRADQSCFDQTPSFRLHGLFSKSVIATLELAPAAPVRNTERFGECEF